MCGIAFGLWPLGRWRDFDGVGLWPLGRWRELFVLGRMFRLQNIRIPKYSAFALLQPDGAAVNSPSAKNCLRACAPAIKKRFCTAAFFLFHELRAPHCHHTPPALRLSHSAGSVLEDSRENVSVLFSCDCAGMLETLSILPHRQGAQPKGGL